MKEKDLDASGAGTIPSSVVNLVVVQATQEKSIDISNSEPRKLTTEMLDEADLVITMGCSVEEACPKPLIARFNMQLVD